VAAAAWQQKRAAAVIKLLALESTHRLHRDQILEALWPDLDVDAGALNLRVALHHARSHLVQAGATRGEYLVRSGESLVLGPIEKIRVDVDAFEHAAARAWRTADLEAIEEALEIYAGDLLPDDPFDDWSDHRRTGLRASYLALLGRLARLAGECGEYDRAIAALQRILGLERAQEETHVALMELLARTGRRSQALDQYRQLTAILEAEIGVKPGPTARALYLAIRDQEVRKPGSMAELANTDFRTNLPAATDGMIGRERETVEIRQLLAATRLVTLTGPGGVGKTRLALAVAGDLRESFPDGIWFVDLAPIRDPALAIPAIGKILGIRETRGRPRISSLTSTLRTRRVLLLLDNFEQVAEAAPDVSELLKACPNLKVLVTSRVRLRVSGECERTIAPLTSPKDSSMEEVTLSDAVRLFVDRAREVRGDFSITAGNAETVAAICHRLDGLPLAIELAVTWIKTLSPETLLTRLEKRLPQLMGGARDLPQRQRTMRATIAWSHDLLSTDEQACFRHLSVFVGGCTLEAAEDVVGTLSANVLELVASLVDKSLLQRMDGGGNTQRYAMLETIREYGLEELAASGDESQVRAAHADYFLELVERNTSRMRGSEAGQALAELEVEYGNLRAALTWYDATGDGRSLLRLAAGLSTFWSENGHWTEGNTWLERALAAEPAPSLVRAEALANLGENAGYLGDIDRAESALQEGLALARQIGATAVTAFMLQSLGGQRVDLGAYAEGESILLQALGEAQRSGDREVEALSLAHLGAASWGKGDVPEATTRLNLAHDLGREHGHTVPAEVAARYLGLMSAERGDVVAATAWFREIDAEPGGMQVPVRLVLDVATLAMALNKPGSSARLFGAASILANAIGIAPSWPERGAHERALEAARVRLGSAFNAVFEAGVHMSREAMLAEVDAVLVGGLQ
jgi:predicted ATPase/DNA-binding SARP family transcriptional activator